MTDQKPLAEESTEATLLPNRNPYIMNFCKVLVEKKGEKHEPEALKKLLDDMYRLYENLLGQNMVKTLPENLRQEYLELSKNLHELSYAKIAEIFVENVPQYKEVMKETMNQFAAIFMRNRQFDPKDYPTSTDFQASARD